MGVCVCDIDNDTGGDTYITCAGPVRWRIDQTCNVVVDLIHVKRTEHSRRLNKLWVAGNLLETNDEFQCFGQHVHRT